MKKHKVYQYDSNGGFIKEYESKTSAATELGVDEKAIRTAIKFKMKCKGFIFTQSELEVEEILFDIRTQKSLQKQMDLNRIKNKKFREAARLDNATEAYALELKALLPKFITNDTIKHVSTEKESIIIVQLSDLHLNELIDLPNNRFDFLEAAKRLQKFAEYAKIMCYTFDASKVIIALTGDIINSDRRLDELVSMSTSRSKATLIAVNLLKQFILDINEVSNIDIVCVSGNESRVKDDIGYTDKMISDNFDYTIFNILSFLFKDKKGIIFHLDQNPVETVINLNGINILIMHGETIKKETQSGIQQIFGKYAAKGINVNYAIFGHVHFANVTDLYARSGSLPGNNVYSDYGLNLVTKSSQNIHIIEKDGSLHNMRIELQNTNGYEGYNVLDDLEAYNAKAADKLYHNKGILKIIT